MAIDFMVMPLSRYLSGDFVTPAMVFAWQQGLPYSLFGPDGRRDIAKDTPFGGADAPANRSRFVPMVCDDLTKLPAPVRARLWDEASVEPPAFHRVDPRSYASLLEEAKARATRSSLLGLWTRTARGAAHVGASLFLPAPFEAPFDMPVVFERVAGSVPAALRELEEGGWSDASRSARETLCDALRDAERLHLPVIVDV